MPKILSVAHSYCSLKSSDVGTMPTTAIADQWQAKNI
jgi:hypothetical protein